MTQQAAADLNDAFDGMDAIAVCAINDANRLQFLSDLQVGLIVGHFVLMGDGITHHGQFDEIVLQGDLDECTDQLLDIALANFAMVCPALAAVTQDAQLIAGSLDTVKQFDHVVMIAVDFIDGLFGEHGGFPV